MVKKELGVPYNKCLELEKEYFTYREMAIALGFHGSMRYRMEYVIKLFKYYEIHHMTKEERMLEDIKSGEMTIKELMFKYKCSREWIRRVKIRNNL